MKFFDPNTAANELAHTALVARAGCAHPAFYEATGKLPRCRGACAKCRALAESEAKR